MQKLLSTSEFADAIGISKSSARRLADSGDVKVQRTKGGHRKISLEEAIRYARENDIDPQGSLLSPFASSPLSGAADVFHQALVVGDSYQAVQILQQEYLGGECVSQIFDETVFGALGKIGQRFPDDKRSIFIEHRAIVICLQSIMQLRALMPPVDRDAKKAICAAPSGDPYLLPSLMCSLVLHEAGFSDVNLGPDTPLDVLNDAIEDESPRIMCLSVTSEIRSRSQVGDIEKLNRTAKENDCSLIIGGRHAAQVGLPDVTLGHSMKALKSWAESLR